MRVDFEEILVTSSFSWGSSHNRNKEGRIKESKYLLKQKTCQIHPMKPRQKPWRHWSHTLKVPKK